MCTLLDWSSHVVEDRTGQVDRSKAPTFLRCTALHSTGCRETPDGMDDVGVK